MTRLGACLLVTARMALAAPALPPPYASALEHARQGNWPAAWAGFVQTMQETPAFGPAYRKAGQVGVALGQEHDAAARFRVMADAPESALAGHLGLAWMAFDRQDWPEAVRLVRIVLERRPQFTSPYLLHNRAAIRVKQTAALLEGYQQWMAREPVNTLPRFAWHHLRVWAGQSTATDLDALQSLHESDRDRLEAWLFSEYQTAERNRALAATRLAAAAGDPELAYLASTLAADLLLDLGRHREAAVVAEHARTQAGHFADPPRVARMLLLACAARHGLGETNAAYAFCSDALRAGEAVASASGAASDASARLAAMDQTSGRWDRAVENLEKSLVLAQRSGFKIVAATRRAELGELLLNLGQAAQAEPLLRENLPVARETALWQIESRVLAVLGRCLSARGDRAGARQSFSEALAIAQAKGDKDSERVVLTEQAVAAMDAGDTADATRLVRATAAAVQASTGNQSDLPLLLALAGDLDIRAGQWDSAARQFAEAAAAGRRIHLDGRAPWEALYGLARVAEQAGRVSEAQARYAEAIEECEQSRSRIPDPLWRGTFFASRQELYQRAIRLTAAQGRIDEAFALLERSRARVLLDFSSSALDALPRANDELAARLSRAERQLLDATLAPSTRAADVDRLRRESDAAAAEYELQASRGRRLQPLGGELPATIESIRAGLDADAAILSYAAGYVFVVTREGVRAHRLRGTDATRAQRVREAAALLAQPPQRLTAFRLGQLLADLYRDLVAPAAAELQRRRRWLISPDGELQRLPFAALLERVQPAGGFDGAAFLGRRVTVSQIPSATAWLRRRERAEPPRAKDLLAAFADAESRAEPGLWQSAAARRMPFTPLPGARREAQALAAIYPRRAISVRLGNEATEAAAKQALEGGARTVHFAVHGFSDGARPTSSALVLTPSADENGLLQAYEVQSLRLSGVDLVVLSACETLAGKDLPGEGAQALASAFLLGGARSVVGSLWRVADASTTALMIAFHREVERGLSPARALRAAQQAAMQDASRAHPYYWAAFQAIGVAD